ncbi:MAG: substrate-binding domain-containing protein, partial [Spirochaetia bacterium]
VPLVRGVYDRDSGMKGAEDLLTVNPNLDIIYGENEEMGLGAAAAVLAKGKQLWNFDTKKGIIVIGADGLVSGYNEIRAGRMTATINVNPVANGRNLIEAIFWDRVLGWRIPKIILAPTSVVDKRNVDLNEAYVKWAQSVKYPSGGYK